MPKKAVILLSGGIDSSVTLALAKAQGFDCYALSVDYQQRNRHELNCAARIAGHLAVAQHRIIRCEMGSWGGSALTDLTMVVDQSTQPSVNTYVPARNTILLSLALGWAEALNSADIFFSANAQDYDNYPDCRPAFFTAFANTANVATRAGVSGHDIKIHTPLLYLNKAQIIREGQRLNVDLSLTFSCYDPIDSSQPCQYCLACELRTQGFSEAALGCS